VRYVLRLLAAAALLLLLTAPALAQGRLLITDPARRLDRAALQRAAQPLIDRGAEVAIYLVQSGGDSDFVSRLTADGLARSDGVARSKLIGIYVALDQRYSSIRFGDGWQAALGVNDNYDLIRKRDFGPGLSDGNYTGAFASAFGGIEQAIQSPPAPDGSVTNNIDTAPLAAAGGLALAAAAGGAVLVNRRRAAKTIAEAQQRLTEAKEGAGGLIADLGQRFKLADEKAAYDKVSYGPADVDRLSKGQAAARQQFVLVQNRFDDTGEQLDRYAKPTLEQLNTATTAYGEVQAAAAAVQTQLGAVEQLRAELDTLAQQAPEEIARAKKS
jgi:uncharacterized membrane protein YgcG